MVIHMATYVYDCTTSRVTARCAAAFSPIAAAVRRRRAASGGAVARGLRVRARCAPVNGGARGRCARGRRPGGAGQRCAPT